MRWETKGGGSAIAGIAVIADIARDRKPEPRHWWTRVTRIRNRWSA